MLRIVDKDNKIKFLLKDEDEEPQSIDELILKELNKEQNDETSDS